MGPMSPILGKEEEDNTESARQGLSCLPLIIHRQPTYHRWPVLPQITVIRIGIFHVRHGLLISDVCPGVLSVVQVSTCGCEYVCLVVWKHYFHSVFLLYPCLITCLLTVVSYQAAKAGIQLRSEGQGKLEKTFLPFFTHPGYTLHGKFKKSWCIPRHVAH
jgi:hypothetical protein